MPKISKVDLDSFTEEKKLAIQLLAQQDVNKLTNQEIADKCGVSLRTLYRWKNDEDFANATVSTAIESVKYAMPDVLSALVAQAKKGSAKHIELLMKMYSLLTDRQEVEATVENKYRTNEDLDREIAKMRERLKNVKPIDESKLTEEEKADLAKQREDSRVIREYTEMLTKSIEKSDAKNREAARLREEHFAKYR